jgi:hypothetical protein
MGGGESREGERRDSLLGLPALLVTRSQELGGRNALDSDSVVGGGVGPRCGLEPARLVPRDQRFSILSWSRLAEVYRLVQRRRIMGRRERGTPRVQASRGMRFSRGDHDARYFPREG